MELNRWQQFQFVVADKALLLSRWVEQRATRQLEMLEPFDPMGRTLQERWRMGFEQFCMYSEMEFRDPKDGKVKPIEFSQRYMERAGICGREVWEVYKRVGVSLGVLVVIPSKGTYYAIRTHTRKTRTQDSIPVAWSRGAVREAFKAGFFTIAPLPLPDSEPPMLNELRFTVARSTQHGLIRTVNTAPPKAPVLPPATTQAVEKPEIKPHTAYTDEPEWLRGAESKIIHVFKRHRYALGQVDVAKVINGRQVFTLRIFHHCEEVNIKGLQEELSNWLGDVGMSFMGMPQEAYVTITAPLPAGVV